MLNLLAIALLALSGQSATEPTVATIAPAVGIVAVGELAVFVHDDLTTTTVPLADLRISEAGPEKGKFVLVGDATNGSSVTTTYESAAGVHEIITPCRGMSAARCVQKHKEHVDAMQAVFPKK